MKPAVRRVLVTGGAGFIGSAVCRKFVSKGHIVCNVDKLTYAANLKSLHEINSAPNYQFVHADICDQKRMFDTIAAFQPDVLLHLAAESHVDRSISDASAFIQTNIVGTVSLLEAALEYWRQREHTRPFIFHHVSTDEVYGELPFDHGKFSETTAYDPFSPYSASKAASDFLALSWFRTHGLPVVVSNCTNNYGPFQNSEKLIPRMIINALSGEPLPVYGEGRNVRDWLHVEDHVAALERVMEQGAAGERYNIGGRNERRNIDVVKHICEELDKRVPRRDGHSYSEQISYVADRPGHDLRYAIDPQKVESELGWRPSFDFEEGLAATVDWYVSNQWWWDTHQ